MEEAVIKILSEVMMIAEERIVPDLRFKELKEYGSVAVLGLLAEVDERLGCQLNKRELDGVSTVYELQELLARKVGRD